jgi:hypothetical protein
MQIPRLYSPVAAACALALAACDAQPPRGAGASALPDGTERDRKFASVNGGGTSRERQAEFLNRIRAADPRHQTIERAVLNEQNELGLILARTVETDKIPALMRSMLTQMAKEFPGEDLNVVAYAPSNPPRKIGTAHLNARTRDMSYTEER